MTLRRTAILLVIGTALVTGVKAQSGALPVSAQNDKQFQAALQKEMVASDPKGAIEDYRRIAERPGVDRALAAQALMRMAECYRKLGDAQAQAVYEQIVQKYADQTSVARDARSRLAALRPAQVLGPAVAAVDLRFDVNWTPSPDGRLAIQTQAQALVLHARDSSSPRTVVTLEEPSAMINGAIAFSPDGKEVAYRVAGLRGLAFRAVNLQSGQSREFIPAGQLVGQANVHRWTTQGVVLTHGARDVVFAAVADGSLRRVSIPPLLQFGDVSPDGSLFCLVGANAWFDSMSELENSWI